MPKRESEAESRARGAPTGGVGYRFEHKRDHSILTVLSAEDEALHTERYAHQQPGGGSHPEDRRAMEDLSTGHARSFARKTKQGKRGKQ
jgi:hypothetical protein